MLFGFLAFLYTWRGLCANHYTPIDRYRSDWKRVLEDCPDPTCAELTSETTYLSYLRLRFAPLTNQHLYTRRYMWLYNSDSVEVGRVIFSEYEGYWIQINSGSCGEPVIFTSTNTTNREGASRYITLRATQNGVHITFPDQGTWAVCTEWTVQRVAFDKLKRVDAWYTTRSNDTTTDLCSGELNNGTQCSTTPYCTDAGFCQNVPSHKDSCYTTDKPSYCGSCSIDGATSCNTTSHCLHPDYLCDGAPQCSNGEDEVGCPPPQIDCDSVLGEDGTCQTSANSSNKGQIIFTIFIIFVGSDFTNRQLE